MKKTAFLAIGFVALLTLLDARAEPIGKMTAVQTQVTKVGAGVIGVGTAISLGDELRSNSTGLGMIVFDDESSAKLGPNSRLTIDEFVYGGGSTGSFGVKMDRGVSRFYGGQVSKKGKMSVVTPHVILGVRGGIVDVRVESARSVAILRAGKLTCSINGASKVISKPGFACVSDGSSLEVDRFGSALNILDSPAKVAGTGAPGPRGPGINVGGGCVGPGAHLLSACSSSHGQLPGSGTVGQDPNGPPFIIRTGPQDNTDQ